MRRIGYILIAAAALAWAGGCEPLELAVPQTSEEEVTVGRGEKVAVSFNVLVPDDAAQTKAMGNTPTIDPDGFYVAVFGGSGYFNEWAKATVDEVASANYDGTAATKYKLTVNLGVSDSRLRVHFIANCPEAYRESPPIAGSMDTEEYVLSRLRSVRTDSYNDGYWQKVILPNGVKVEKTTVGSEEVFVATAGTLSQFPDPIVLVRDFARIYLRNLTPKVGAEGDKHQLVTIKKFALAYAPSEGVIAPILASSYPTDESGALIDDEESASKVYFENFFVNYQNYPISSDDPGVTLLSDSPFNYVGYSPDNQAYDYYPSNADKGIPTLADMQDWDSDHPENNVLFVYERTIPSASRRATRIIIQAERRDAGGSSEGDLFYALDIVNGDGRSIPLLRNQSYTVCLLNIEEGSGEDDLSSAAKATSAMVSGNPEFQDLVNISDGKSSIGASFTEKFYVAPQDDYVMFRYLPTSVADENYAANEEGNELVTVSVGSVNRETGVFTALTPAEASAQGVLAFATSGSDYDVRIEKSGDVPVAYVRSNNDWVVATEAQIANPEVEKWGKISYALNDSYVASDGYYTQERSQAIHIEGSYNGREMSRNVIIKTSPRQAINVSCLQKYVLAMSGQTEVVRVTIPSGLSRSVFPLEFLIEADGYSLTPDGDVLPVSYGTSIVPGNEGPAFYFVKTMTQAAYDAIPSSGGTKSFDCHFKTTLSDNACTVYVRNRYFRDDEADDDFKNFLQRNFTDGTVPTEVYSQANHEFSFVMDYAHRAGTTVWWDPTNYLGQSSSAEEALEKGLSTTNRVLPPELTVTLTGLTAAYESDGVTPLTPNLEHKSGNIYIYHVGALAPTSSLATFTLALKATGAIGSEAKVMLSTENLTDNPTLYAVYNVSKTIRGAAFTTLFSRPSTNLALGLNKTTTFNFTYAEGLVKDAVVHLNGLALNGTDARMTDNGDGTYTFHPTDENVRTYSLNLKSSTRFGAGTVTLSADGYESKVTTISRATSFTIPQSALYVRGDGDGNPTNFTTGNGRDATYVYLNSSTNYSNYSYLARSSYSSSYLNNSTQVVTLSNFTIVNDDATVYFIYEYERWWNDTYYYATAKLSELLDATSTNRVTLKFSTTRPS